MSHDVVAKIPDIPDGLISQFEMQSGLVYALPAELLESLKTELPKVFTGKIFSDECALLAVAAERKCIAFRCCNPVRFPRLAPSIEPVTAELVKLMLDICQNPADQAASPTALCENPEEQAAILTAYLETARRYSVGYCGWLVQQRDFWSEIDTLLETHGDAFSETELGFPPMRLGVKPIPVTPEYTDEGVECVKAIYHKWRLQQLVTTDLPMPHEPQMAAANAYVQSAAEGAVTPHIPDIFPIDGTGPIVEQMENARNSLQAPHLNEWKKLIGSESRQKKLVDTYARQFQFQHYFRVIRQRYPDQLRRKKGALYQAFASYFEVSKDAIERDASKLDDLLDRPLHAML